MKEKKSKYYYEVSSFARELIYSSLFKFKKTNTYGSRWIQNQELDKESFSSFKKELIPLIEKFLTDKDIQKILMSVNNCSEQIRNKIVAKEQIAKDKAKEQAKKQKQIEKERKIKEKLQLKEEEKKRKLADLRSEKELLKVLINRYGIQK